MQNICKMRDRDGFKLHQNNSKIPTDWYSTASKYLLNPKGLSHAHDEPNCYINRIQNEEPLIIFLIFIDKMRNICMMHDHNGFQLHLSGSVIEISNFFLQSEVIEKKYLRTLDP